MLLLLWAEVGEGGSVEAVELVRQMLWRWWCCLCRGLCLSVRMVVLLLLVLLTNSHPCTRATPSSTYTIETLISSVLRAMPVVKTAKVASGTETRRRAGMAR